MNYESTSTSTESDRPQSLKIVHSHRVRSSTIPQDRPLPPSQIVHNPSRSSTPKRSDLPLSIKIVYFHRSSTITQSDRPLCLKIVHFHPVRLTTFPQDRPLSSHPNNKLRLIQAFLVCIQYTVYPNFSRKGPNFTHIISELF